MCAGHVRSCPVPDTHAPLRSACTASKKAVPLLMLLLILLVRPGGSAFTAYTLGANYSRRESPGKFSGQGQMTVSLRFRIMDILAVNEFNSELSLDLLLHRYWSEPRIRFTASAQPGRLYPVDPLDRDKFWKPDLYVLGMREFRTMAGSVGLDHLVLRHDRSVQQLLRGTLQLRCRLDFRLFPLDSQECKMDIMSPTSSLEELSLQWWAGGRPVEFYRRDPPLRLPLTEYDAQLVACPRSFAALHVAGNVSALRVWLVLHRHALSHVLEIYLPTGLFVVISWGSFLVKPEMVPGRMVLLVTNLLSLVTIFEASRSTAPPAPGLKCLDVWLLSCIIFLFFALLEYAAILMQLRGRLCRERSRRQGLTFFVASGRSTPVAATAATTAAAAAAHGGDGAARDVSLGSQLLRKLRTRVRHFTWQRWLSSPRDTSWCLLDQLSVFAFPAAFLLFNVVYWGTYLQASLGALQSTTCERATGS